MFRFGLTAAVGVLIGTAALGQTQDAKLAEVSLERRIAALSANPGDHQFELGALTTLRAVEKSLQTRYEYGLGDRLNTLPMMRLNMPQINRAPKRPQADTLSGLFKTLLQDLDDARGYLEAAATSEDITPFELTLQDVWFDVNANGQRDEGEAATESLLPLLMGRRAMRDMGTGGLLDTPITVRFDVSDHAWLTAYTHMLSGAGNLFLAFDPTPVINRLNAGRADLAFAPTIPSTYDKAALTSQIEELKAEQERIKAAHEPLLAEQARLRAELRELKNVKKADRDTAQIDAVQQQYNAVINGEARRLQQQKRFIRTEIRAAEAKIKAPRPGIGAQFSREIDTIYTVLAALRQQPDKARITATRDHWRSMIAQNRDFWAALELETDNDREWIPNPRQTSVLPVVVDADIIAAWQAILADAEDVLEGRLLLPHPLLPEGQGINVAAYFEDPTPIELLDWVHGIGVYPFVAKGPIVTRQRWLAFQRLTAGNAGGFALFFN